MVAFFDIAVAQSCTSRLSFMLSYPPHHPMQGPFPGNGVLGNYFEVAENATFEARAEYGSTQQPLSRMMVPTAKRMSYPACSQISLRRWLSAIYLMDKVGHA